MCGSNAAYGSGMCGTDVAYGSGMCGTDARCGGTRDRAKGTNSTSSSPICMSAARYQPSPKKL
eukprot:3932929-Rhodomonas_salina.1